MILPEYEVGLLAIIPKFSDSKSSYCVLNCYSLSLSCSHFFVKREGRQAPVSKHHVRKSYRERILGLPLLYPLGRRQGVSQSRGGEKTEIYRDFLLSLHDGIVLYKPRQLPSTTFRIHKSTVQQYSMLCNLQLHGTDSFLSRL